ncbi:HBL012Cp [Eremothecium sinecaudum]|uniref:HBL012Cp n=1 Tax=Eremothecium sinecaudum TaxID=45286 RepID=A0A109UWN3_9SACH|nr:HBL012Cp [Eremothecium sinecaudum]AMD18890.1 HBL012Cp [Eremothecium sinecaudum]
MLKSSRFVSQLGYPTSGEMTPIRDYEREKALAAKMKTLNKLRNNPYAIPLWESSGENKRAIDTINDRSRSNDCNGKPRVKHRPKTLNLEDLSDRETKRMDSPLNLGSYNDYLVMRSPKIDSRLLNFLDTIRKLVETEEEYYQTLELANSAYRNELNANRKVRNQILEESRNDELLLFGDIETISSISRLLVGQIKNKIAGSAESKLTDDIWHHLRVHPKETKAILDDLNIPDILRSHLERVKFLYLNYSVNHEKQLQLLQDRKRRHGSTFYRWYGKGLQRAGSIRLEVLLALPIERLDLWMMFAEELMLYSEGTISEVAAEKLSSFYNDYSLYLKRVKRSQEEFKAKKDMNQSPSEIIEFYNTCFNDTTCSLSRSLTNATKAITLSSSIYSEEYERKEKEEDMIGEKAKRDMGDAFYDKHDSEDLRRQDDEDEQFDIDYQSFSRNDASEDHDSLKKYVRKFNILRKGFSSLYSHVDKLNLMEVLDKRLENTKTWQRLMEFDSTVEAKDDIYISSIYSAFIDKINHQKEKVMVLRISQIKKGFLEPLGRFIARSNSISTKIEDLRTLGREYRAYQRQKEHDIKKEVLAKSYEAAKLELLNELPTFFNISQKLITYILLKYQSIMLEYMKILCGGNNILEKELQLAEENDREFGDNFDILQIFSSSRFYTKQAVRENWQFPGKPSASRVLRKLFEL